MIERIKHWWYRFRMKWAMRRLERAWKKQAKEVGELILPTLQSFIESIEQETPMEFRD